MPNETLARRYATAVFSLASDAGSVERVGSELGTILRTIHSDPAILQYFRSPVVNRVEKEKTLLDSMRGKVSDIPLHTLLLLVRKRREPLLEELVLEYSNIARAARGVDPLMVTTARELSDGEVRALVDRLERTYGKKFEASVTVDPSLIGGVRVAMGDRLIDGSVAGRLEELTRSLFGSN
ncbi:MAG TPA: ATP synthase F1 subunit delta [Verrucomicrobiae bacterium]|nr:ATP synthase F1 subunit delta [Verrucomicrobiae bacterium]